MGLFGGSSNGSELEELQEKNRALEAKKRELTESLAAAKNELARVKSQRAESGGANVRNDQYFHTALGQTYASVEDVRNSFVDLANN